MFIIKVKGKAKIPDYIQIRDNNYVLVAYFRADRPEKNLSKIGYENREEEFKKLIETLPFGIMQQLPE
ncbi:MAG: fructose-6-phosphate aldolase [Cytophagales bacterium]